MILNFKNNLSILQLFRDSTPVVSHKSSSTLSSSKQSAVNPVSVVTLFRSGCFERSDVFDNLRSFCDFLASRVRRNFSSVVSFGIASLFSFLMSPSSSSLPSTVCSCTIFQFLPTFFSCLLRRPVR